MEIKLLEKENTPENVIEHSIAVCKKAMKIAAEKVKKSKKLLKLQVMIGDEERTIVSGIAQYYEPEALIGRNVIVIANLAPAKLFGIESFGMLLAASDGNGNLVLADAPGMASGSRVK